MIDNGRMIDKPIMELDRWVAHFRQGEIPVLRHTLQQLARLKEQATTTNARSIASVILHDPLMTLRVLAYIEARRGKSQFTDITTIEHALMMIGMEPFFNDFNELPLVEDKLKAHPRALLGLLRVINRSRKAMYWARDWAIYRHDLDVDEVIVATLLYDFAEMLVWCFAPTLAVRTAERLAADKALRSAAVQTEVFGIPLYQLKLALADGWHLPQLLTTLMDPQHAELPRVRNVKLAVDLARHSANGWDDAALPDDLRAIGDLLHLSPEAVMQKFGQGAAASGQQPSASPSPQAPA